MIIRLSVIKIVRSINDKISEWYDHNFLFFLIIRLCVIETVYFINSDDPDTS